MAISFNPKIREASAHPPKKILNLKLHPRNLTASLPLKNDAWKMSGPFWDCLFLGAMLNFRGVRYSYIEVGLSPLPVIVEMKVYSDSLLKM